MRTIRVLTLIALVLTTIAYTYMIIDAMLSEAEIARIYRSHSVR